MTTEADPIVGNWYEHLDKGQKFRVVALDEDERIVEIQDFNGDVDEIGLDDWYQLDVDPIEAPENWSGPVDITEVDDLGTQITDTTSDDWAAPQQEIKPQEPGASEEEAEDEWDEGRPKEEPYEGEL
jgi:hypothetical protein